MSLNPQEDGYVETVDENDESIERPARRRAAIRACEDILSAPPPTDEELLEDQEESAYEEDDEDDDEEDDEEEEEDFGEDPLQEEDGEVEEVMEKEEEETPPTPQDTEDEKQEVAITTTPTPPLKSALKKESKKSEEKKAVTAPRRTDGNDALLIVDCQNDFFPEADDKALASYIRKHADSLKTVIVVQHCQSNGAVQSIMFNSSWVNPQGQLPDPGTVITFKDVNDHTWDPVIHQLRPFLLKYLKRTTLPGITVHKPFAVEGTRGAGYPYHIHSALHELQIPVERKEKSKSIYAEHYSAFRAVLPITQDERTRTDKNLLIWLRTFDHVHVAGPKQSIALSMTKADLRRGWSPTRLDDLINVW